MRTVTVITNLELGWDNVVAVVADSVTKEELQKAFPDSSYVFTVCNVETDVSDHIEQ